MENEKGLREKEIPKVIEEQRAMITEIEAKLERLSTLLAKVIRTEPLPEESGEKNKVSTVPLVQELFENNARLGIVSNELNRLLNLIEL